MASKKPASGDDLATPDQAAAPSGPAQIELHPVRAESVFARFAQRQLMYETQDAESIQDLVWMRSGCLPFDLITSGKGMPRGRTMLLYSGFGVGKTTLLFSAARGFCQNGYKVVYADGESSDDTAAQMGLIGPEDTLEVPKGSFKYLSFRFYKELEEIANAFLESDYDILMVDSITAAGVSKSTRDKALAKKKTVEDAESIGVDARIQTKFVKNLFLDLKDGRKAAIFIAQERNKIDMANPYNNGPKAAASNAALFFANIQVKMKPSTVLKDGVRTIGRMAYLFSEKNRHAPPFVNVPTTVFFGRGVSNIDLLTKLGKWLGIFVTKGAWTEIHVPNKAIEKVSGSIGLSTWIKEHYEAMTSVFYDNAEEFLKYFGNGEKDISSADLVLGAASSPSDCGDEGDSGEGSGTDPEDLVAEALDDLAGEALEEDIVDLG